MLRPLRLGIITLYALTMLIVTIVIIWSAWRDYQRTLQDAEKQTFSLARLLDEHATRSIISVEQAMQNISEDIQRAGGVSSADERTMYEQFKAKVELTPQTRAIIAMDEKGIIRIHGLEYPARHIDLSDREYFAPHRDSQGSRARIGTPIVSRTDNKWLIPLTRRINRPDGSFGGIMLAGMEPNYFLNFYESLKLDRTMRIQLLRSDGVVLLTYPLDPTVMGRNLHTSDPTTYEKLARTSAAFLATHNSKGAEIYITQLANQTDLPLSVRVISDSAQVFSKFRQETMIKVTSAALLMLVVSVMTYMLLRQINRVNDAESRLYFTQFSVDESPDMILWCDQAGRVRYTNRCLAETCLYSPDELLKLTFMDLLVDCEEMWESLQVQMLMLKKQPDNIGLRTELQAQRRHILQAQLQGRTDRKIPVEITLSLIEFNAEVYLCISARDITERQETERELRHHRDHLQEMVDERTAEIRTVLDASPLAIVLSVQGKIRLANPAFESLFGHPASSVIGQAESLIFGSKSSYTQAIQSIRLRLEEGGTYRGEMELHRKDGSDFWALLFARALSPHAPERGAILIIEDITAQRIAAQAVRQSERLKRTIIDTTADGFALIDARRHLVDVNSSFCEALGLKRENLINQQPEAIWGELAERIFPRCPNAAAEKHFEEIVLPTGNGTLCPFLANSGVIPDEHGQIEYTFVFLTNITHQKEIERSLLESKEAAESANKAKTVFLANMSHELRTPMHAILSFSEMGINKVGQIAPEHIYRYFERIQSSGKRLLALLNDLLDMSRLEANKMVYDKSRQSLQSTVNNAVTEISSLLASKRLQVLIDENLPAVTAFYDKSRITQVLVNLLSNAIKFSPDSARIYIDFISDAQLDNGIPAVGLSVRDEGPGIPEQDLDHIFDTFTQSKQAHTATGTGLGLAISRQIMFDHNGSIVSRNHPSGGAVFTLLLPVVPGN
ncbi:MAG: PAS domain S-box protein [Formivibrio sp.]|nr:PAS domain S-box protein [Formivibrio sp.]